MMVFAPTEGSVTIHQAGKELGLGRFTGVPAVAKVLVRSLARI